MAFTPPSIQSIYSSKQLKSPMAQVGLLIIVIALFSWFIVKPKFSVSMEAHKELNALEKQRSIIEAEEDELNRLVSQLQSAGQEVELVDEALPLTGRVSRIDVLIDTLAVASGLKVAQINADASDSFISAGNKEVLKDPYGVGRDLQTVTVTALVTGDIEKFRNFLELLETNGRILDVSSLEITNSEVAVAEGEDRTQFRVKIKAYAYEVK